jgi:hypothetical protein
VFASGPTSSSPATRCSTWPSSTPARTRRWRRWWRAGSFQH